MPAPRCLLAWAAGTNAPNIIYKGKTAKKKPARTHFTQHAGHQYRLLGRPLAMRRRPGERKSAGVQAVISTPVPKSVRPANLPTAQRRPGVDEESLRSMGISQLRVWRFDRGVVLAPYAQPQHEDLRTIPGGTDDTTPQYND
jgi:hypothetical protein